MPSQLLLSDTQCNGTRTVETTLPADAGDLVYLTLIYTAPVSDLNVFDIGLVVEADRGDGWTEIHRHTYWRNLLDGEVEAVSLSERVQVPRVAGCPLRLTYRCGQSLMSVSLAVEW